MNQIYFVSSSGSNSNDGSNVAPWATVQYAIDTITSQSLVPNTDLFIKEGSYPEVVYLTPFLGSGTITLKAQTVPPLIQGLVQTGSIYSLDQINVSNPAGNAIVVEAGTLLIKNIILSTSDSCISVRGNGVASTSGTLEVNGNIGSVISCTGTGLFLYNSTLIGNGTFTRAFCQISGGKVTVFNSLSSNSFGGDRVNISGGILTVKTTSTSPIDTLPGSSYGFATGGQIFNDTTQIFPTDSTLNATAASVINAGLITQGTISNSRLSPTVTTQGNIFNGPNQLVRTNPDGKLPPLDGSLLTGITLGIPSASNITAGTLNNSRLAPEVTLAGNVFNGPDTLLKLTSLGKLPAVDGSQLTNLPSSSSTDASLLSSGTLANARLTSLVTLGGNTFNTANNLVRTDVLNRLPAIDGSQLTNLPGGNSTDASSLVSGTLNDTRLSSNVTLQGNIFNAASKLVKTDSLNRLPAVDGSQLTGLPSTTDASLLTSGTVADARLSDSVTIQGNTFNVANGLVKTDGSNRLPAIDGSQLTNLPAGSNASSLTTGTVADARLTTNVTLAGNTFNGNTQLVQTTSTGKLPALDGSLLTNLPGGGGGTTIPPTVQTIGNGTLQSFTITHNQGTKNVGVLIYETASPYEVVQTTVKNTTTNTVTIETGIVPTTDQFTVVVYSLSGASSTSTPSNLVSSTMTAFGDSITVGQGATSAQNQYINLVSANTNWPLANNAVSGREVIDMADAVYNSSPSESTQFFWLAGFNDLRNYLTNALGQSTFKNALSALSAWLTIPTTKRKKGQDSSITYSGSWSDSANYGGTLAKTSSTASNTATFTFSGSTLLVAYTKLASGTGSFSLAVDGGSAVTFTGENAVASLNGRTYAPCLAIVSNLSESFHTAVLTVTSGTVNLEWVAGVDDAISSYSGPNLFLGNVLRMTSAAFGSPPSSIDGLIGTYNTLIKEAINPLISTGLKIYPVNTNSRFLLSDVAVDNIHPNDSGHLAIARAFIDKVRSIPGLLVNTTINISSLSGPTPLIFATRTSNLSSDLQSSSGAAYANCYGLASKLLLSGTDGWVQYNVGSFENVLLGFNTAANNESYPNYEFGVWVGGGLYYTIQSGSVLSSGIASVVNSLLRLKRTGSVITAEYSINNGVSWINVRTFSNASTTDLYVNINIDGVAKAIDVRSTGFV